MGRSNCLFNAALSLSETHPAFPAHLHAVTIGEGRIVVAQPAQTEGRVWNEGTLVTMSKEQLLHRHVTWPQSRAVNNPVPPPPTPPSCHLAAVCSMMQRPTASASS